MFKGFGVAVCLMGALAGAMSGCAGGSLGRVGGEGELPKDLPKDIKEKFEIKDVAEVMGLPDSGVASPGAKPQAAGAKSRKKSAAKGKVGAKSAPAAFVYPNRRPAKDPIWIGEKQVYEITYLGMSAGDFTLTVLPPKMMNNRKVYHVRGHALSSKLFSLIYSLDDLIQSYIDYEGIFSHRFHLLLDETKQMRDSLELYDSEKKQTFYWNRWNRREKGYFEVKEFHPMPEFPQDSMSALFYLRTLPLPTGAVINFPVVNEGKNWMAEVTVVRRERLETAVGKIDTIVLKPETKYQGLAKKSGDSFIWLTDDERRILVRMDAKVKIGTVVAQIKSIEPGTPPAPAPAPIPSPSGTAKE